MSSGLNAIFSLHQTSGAVEDGSQSAPMLAFALEGATYRGKGLGERKNVASDKQIGVLGAYWMPVDTLSCYGDLRQQISASKCDPLCSDAPQCNTADHSVLFVNPLGIEEAPELFCLLVGGDRRC